MPVTAQSSTRCRLQQEVILFEPLPKPKFSPGSVPIRLSYSYTHPSRVLPNTQTTGLVRPLAIHLSTHPRKVCPFPTARIQQQATSPTHSPQIPSRAKPPLSYDDDGEDDGGLLASRGTVWILGVMRSSASLSASLGVSPNFASAAGVSCRPSTPQATRPSPTRALERGVRDL